MSNTDNNNKTKGEASPLRYDIRNPTRARRIIHDGIQGSMKMHTLEPKGTEGDTKLGVLLHNDIVKELRERNKAKPDSDIQTKLCAPEGEKSAA